GGARPCQAARRQRQAREGHPRGPCRDVRRFRPAELSDRGRAADARRRQRMHLARAVAGIVPAETARRNYPQDSRAEEAPLRTMTRDPDIGATVSVDLTVQTEDTAAALSRITG